MMSFVAIKTRQRNKYKTGLLPNTIHKAATATMVQLVGFLLIALCAAAQARPEAQVDVHDVIPGIGEYYFNGVPANWSTAFKQCQSSGGHLTVINSVAEKEALQEMMTRHGADSILVGFHDQFVEGIYSFITGWSVPDSLWASGYPVGGSANNCGSLDSNGIKDASCSELGQFICELSADQGGEAVNDGFVLLENFGYYKFHDEALSWTQAWKTCREENSDLLVLETKEEEKELWYSYSYLFSWVGVHRQWGPDDNFLSVRNVPLSQLGYQTWYLEVGTYMSYPYVGIYNGEGMMTLRPDYERSFFCERPLH